MTEALRLPFLALLGLYTAYSVLTNARGPREEEAGGDHRGAWYLFHLGPLWAFLVDHPVVVIRFATVAVAEEIIWRAGAQPVLSDSVGAPAAIVLIAVAFAVVHKHVFVNAFLVSLEFLAFALLLGVLYHFTESLILVILIHAVRDIEIVFLDYQSRLEALGDDARASEEVEASLRRGAPAPRAGLGAIAASVMQTALFAAACVYAQAEGAFSRQLVSPLYIGAGLLAGHVVFGLSLVIVNRRVQDL